MSRMCGRGRERMSSAYQSLYDLYFIYFLKLAPVQSVSTSTLTFANIVPISCVLLKALASS